MANEIYSGSLRINTASAP